MTMEKHMVLCPKVYYNLYYIRFRLFEELQELAPTIEKITYCCYRK